MYDISRLLRDNPYPGRGIVLGRSGDDRCSVLAYFIMGRSANSRNRVFVRTDDGIRAQAFDPAAMTDPKGILYNPVRRIGEAWVVSNGDQTDAIRDCFAVGRPWEEALRASTFQHVQAGRAGLHAAHLGPAVSGRALCPVHPQGDGGQPALLPAQRLRL